MFLGFYGAEVIKVESESLEANREPTRPLFPDMNRAKLSCTIDMRSDQGKDLFRTNCGAERHCRGQLQRHRHAAPGPWL